MFMTWWAYVFIIIIFLFIFKLSWCLVTLVGAFGCHITILYFNGLAAYIIVLDTKAP